MDGRQDNGGDILGSSSQNFNILVTTQYQLTQPDALLRQIGAINAETVSDDFTIEDDAKYNDEGIRRRYDLREADEEVMSQASQIKLPTMSTFQAQNGNSFLNSMNSY